MNTAQFKIVNANQAVAEIAYKTNEVLPIYPITPASEMSELVEQWSAQKNTNIYNSVPTTFEMQSEAGVAGTMHGALQTGSLSSTFTASQGLLLMLPNMYKIAGELTPNVIHVASRSVATHALSVYGDHSDIMAVRQSGYAFLGSASVQEAQDFALIAQAASLRSRIPFVHFFDGFRTSHEVNKIQGISDHVIKTMVNDTLVNAHRNRALDPNKPVIRGTSQTADVFFQSREAVNSYYEVCPDLVQNEMDTFSELTGRQYRLFDYIGHPEAKHVIISMASSTETIEQTINYLNKKGEQYGLIKVRLYRPFSTKHLIEALPKTVKSIAVLDRTKEPGASGEPLYLDVVHGISEAFQNQLIKTLPKIVGGRYGLSSKEFTPAMVNAICYNLKEGKPKNNFTVGIEDDLSNLSLDVAENLHIDEILDQAVFYTDKKTALIHNSNSFLKLLASNGHFIQRYTECDYKKALSRNVSHLRMGTEPIKAPYLISQSNFVFCQHIDFINKDNAVEILKENGILLVDTSLTQEEFANKILDKKQVEIRKKNIQFYIVDTKKINARFNESNQEIAVAQACFLALQEGVFYTEEIAELISHIKQIELTEPHTNSPNYDNDFNATLLGKLLQNKGNEITVSQLPVDGTYNSNTSEFNASVFTGKLPVWNADACTQCGACSMACPQAALRIKVIDNEYQSTVPKGFKSKESDEFDLLNYTLQINPDQCNACNNCIDACPIKGALEMQTGEIDLETEKENWTYFNSIPEFDRKKIDIAKLSQQQLQEPLFKYSIGVEGCGEAPYLKLMSQLFGDRLMIANATGASSIFGGALPTTPWSKNKEGRGPAWSNSLFEDNAEFGLGFRLSLDQQKESANKLVLNLLHLLDNNLAEMILNSKQDSEFEILEQRIRVERLKLELEFIKSNESKQLLKIVDSLVKKSVWIVGGDGWAYDIGYGGLDHVIASGKNVNILVLDNEVYDNTGGQASKATPFGSEAKFAFGGKVKQKKDLGMMAMNYEDVYVASIAIGADQEQTLKAFREAESYDGPSIIIAYSHSKSHGIDMKNPSKYHKAAVASGQWNLYRNDPRNEEKNRPTLQLDSPRPTLKIEEYLKLEKRFSKLIELEKEPFDALIDNYQKKIDSKFKKLSKLSFLHIEEIEPVTTL